MNSGPLGTRPLARLAILAATVGALLFAFVGIAGAIDDDPVASFTMSVKVPDPDDAVTLDASASSDPDGIALYRWDFDNDGTVDLEESDPVATHTFTSEVSTTVKLEVEDNEGRSSDPDATKTFTPDQNVAPTANFSVPANALPGGVTFNGSGSTDPQGDDTITSFAWDIDDDGQFDDATGEIPTVSLAAGVYPAQLRVTDEHGEPDDSATHTVTVNTPPSAGFHTSNTPSQALATPTNFVSDSSDADAGQTLSYEWEFGGDGDGLADPPDSTSTNPSHQFTDDGSFQVRVTVTDSLGGEDVEQHAVTVDNVLPTAAFTPPTNPQQGVAAAYDGSANDPDGDASPTFTYGWEFTGAENFTDATGENPNITFATNGEKTVKMRATDEDGGVSDVVEHQVYVNAKPTAGFTHDTLIQNSPTSFNGSFTDPDDPNDECDTIDSWDWTFKQGATTIGTRSVENPSFTFPDEGSYSVELDITDSCGGTDTETQTVNVPNIGPDAHFTLNPSTVVTGQTVTFTSDSTDPDGTIAPSDIDWELDGDDLYDDASGVQTTGQFAGDRVVKLRVTDDDGDTDFFQAIVNVVDGIAPAASFNFFPQAPVEGDTVMFTSTSSDADGPLVSQAWDLDADDVFGEAGELGTSVSRVFSTPGDYTVALRVMDQDDLQDTEFQTVTVGTKPPPSNPGNPNPPSGPTINNPSGVPSLLSPFPIVRVRGKLVRGGTRITLLTVAAPRGATVTVRCKGRTCPFGSKSQTARSSRVRIKGLSGTLRPGVKIYLYVEKTGSIGKYTRFAIRRGKAPLRTDACLQPGSKRPRQCPQ